MVPVLGLTYIPSKQRIRVLGISSFLTFKVDVIRIGSGEPSLRAGEISGAEVIEPRLNVPFFESEFWANYRTISMHTKFENIVPFS
jgi:hypothetical protein